VVVVVVGLVGWLEGCWFLEGIGGLKWDVG
jgi:hypothetical protein